MLTIKVKALITVIIIMLFSLYSPEEKASKTQPSELLCKVQLRSNH